MNIETMEAGPELNRLVHERVMGECRRHNWESYCAHPSDMDEPTNLRCTRCGLIGAPDYAKTRYPIPKYSTEIGDARRVERRMREQGWDVDFHPLSRQDGDLYLVSFRRYIEGEWKGHINFTMIGETVPLAICRAALAAGGG